MKALVFSPELLRNARIQLRPRRMLATILICAVSSLALVVFFKYPVQSSALELLNFVIFIQIAASVIGGGIYCLQSIHREKELNTFDFQRLTRLTPLELTMGKAAGAPVLIFLVVLCLVPLAVWAGFEAGVAMYVLAEIYGILLIGGFAYGLFALLASLLVGRSASAGAILFYLVVVGMSSIDFSTGNSAFAVHRLSPFFALELLSTGAGRNVSPVPPLGDVFFGAPMPHMLALSIIYLTFAGWLLLALARNIKKDPSIYEIFSPVQALLFVLYVDLLMVGFFRWMIPIFTNTRTGYSVSYRVIPPADAEATLLALSLVPFVVFGFSLLRNRERTRRHISRFGLSAGGWWAAIWPAPYLISGALIFGLSVIALIQLKLQSEAKWSIGMGTVEVAFFAVWLARDATYLQWMSLRHTRRPLTSGVLYLAVFYTCMSALITAIRARASYAAALIPSFAFGMDSESWLNHRSFWFASLAILIVETTFFAWLQRRELRALLSTTPLQAESWGYTQ